MGLYTSPLQIEVNDNFDYTRQIDFMGYIINMFSVAQSFRSDDAINKYKLMKEIVLEHYPEFGDPFNPKLRHTCYEEFKQACGGKRTMARKYYNAVVSDLREILPLGDLAMQAIFDQQQEKQQLGKVINDLEKDINYLRTGSSIEEGQNGMPATFDNSMILGKHESEFGAKSTIRDQIIKTIGLKADISKNLGELAIKMIKTNTDKDKNDLTDAKNKLLGGAVDTADFDKIEEQFEKFHSLEDMIIKRNENKKAIPAQYTVVNEETMNESTGKVSRETQPVPRNSN